MPSGAVMGSVQALPMRGPAVDSVIPFSTFVVKVASRCNLNCSYCYMYNLADQTYRGQPAVMNRTVTSTMARRIASHATRHRLPWVHIILHGGEPLLMGRRHLAQWVAQVRETLKGHTVPYFSMQSNGTLIDADWIDLLADLSVTIGISVDGPKRFHDEYRVDHYGDGSFDNVVESIRALQSHPRGLEVFSCVMAVVNTEIPPEELF